MAEWMMTDEENQILPSSDWAEVTGGQIAIKYRSSCSHTYLRLSMNALSNLHKQIVIMVTLSVAISMDYMKQDKFQREEVMSWSITALSEEKGQNVTWRIQSNFITEVLTHQIRPSHMTVTCKMQSGEFTAETLSLLSTQCVHFEVKAYGRGRPEAWINQMQWQLLSVQLTFMEPVLELWIYSSIKTRFFFSYTHEVHAEHFTGLLSPQKLSRKSAFTTIVAFMQGASRRLARGDFIVWHSSDDLI